ncbi:hypothetical protein EK21DRAFT_89194 [Setomelanomma holmii]|uniref:Zn(2)-C6 fungal-type domain-containing protein n=1 Tax=Setomelanomma holmii TaxID=210430 RepID=A0A9P4H978_9PLEO|nr:hypothetical protein EK21DRAFT_89194 [Setomelanomma holmii]
MAEAVATENQRTKTARTRHGCLNCKRKRRKCDEVKPSCGRCRDRGDNCTWGSRVIFRNANTIRPVTEQPPTQARRHFGAKPIRFEIKDITSEIIRDYHQFDHVDNTLETSDGPSRTTASFPQDEQGHQTQFNSVQQNSANLRSPSSGPSQVKQHTPHTPLSQVDPTSVCTTLPTTGNLHSFWDISNATLNYDDSVFLPDSAYLDAHATLRSHLMYEIRSAGTTRHTTPAADPYLQESDLPVRVNADQNVLLGAERATTPLDTLLKSTALLQSSKVALSEAAEFELWKNWIDEIAPWLDKFDSDRHFQHVLPIMARSHDHLRYSMLALSARQLERKSQSIHTEKSLSLYQKAIQLVLPELHARSTPVLATCVVLCVLEMSSSSAKAWRHHLDGCANLIQAVGIHGNSGGVNQALFWCFSRMDVCGGLIASEKTLIPITHWLGDTDSDTPANRVEARVSFDAYACDAVYLCAQVLDLLALQPQLARYGNVTTSSANGLAYEDFTGQWSILWSSIDDWCNTRPPEMHPISSTTVPLKPFPLVLYSNPAAISGNQLYHTACILMLRHKPSSINLSPESNIILWHAHQVCAISTSNHHHGAWNNSIQPLWIAGQLLSEDREREAVLELYERIERETGWGTKWRAEDLKAHWTRE